MKRYIYDPHFIGEETAERVTCLSLRSPSVTRLALESRQLLTPAVFFTLLLPA